MKLSFLAILASVLMVACLSLGHWNPEFALQLGICGVGVAVLSLRDSE